MKKRIGEANTKARKALEVPGSYPFLPEIIKMLEKMQDGIELEKDRRVRMAAALGRLVTEDFSFSESELGGELLRLGEDFSQE